MNLLRRLFRVASLLRSVASAALILAFIATAVTPSFAAGGTSGGITGTITDSATNRGLANAQITATSPSQRATTTTDARGFFSFQQLPVDTYTLSVTSPGYQSLTITGITVQGDQTVSIQPQGLQKQIATIGRTRARSASSVVQPNQTVDQVTLSGDRVTQATGKTFSTNLQQLALAAPGVSLTAGGNLSVRGSRATDVGYQYEGVDFRDPQGNAVGANTFNGLASLQVVGGAGDASQGNVGAGVVNLTVKRGARPAFGSLDLEARAPYYGHQLGAEYGFATPNGRLSDYVSFIGQRNDTQCGPRGADAATNNCFLSPSFQKIDDTVNNLVYRFGKDNNQSLELLTRIRRADTYGELGGQQGALSGGCPQNTSSGASACIPFQYYTNDPRFKAIAASVGLSGAQFVQQVPLVSAGVPLPGQNIVPNGPPDLGAQNLAFTLLTYARTFGANTSLTARYFNWNTRNARDFTYGRIESEPLFSTIGGATSGANFDLVRQFGEHHTVSLSGKFENTLPIRDEPDALLGLLGPSGNSGNPNTTLNLNQWLNPANTTQPLTPVGGSNPCPVDASVDPTACYLYSQGYAQGGASFWGPGGVPRIPAAGVGYRGADYQNYGIGLSDLFVVSSKLRFDIGARLDGANYKQAVNQYGQLSANGLTGVTPDNPQDVDPSTVTASYRKPTVFEPRAAFSLQVTPQDSVRFGFGRSVNFVPGQGFGTPWTLYNAPSQLAKIGALDSATTPECGSGVNVARGAALGQAPNGSGQSGFFKCANYANQLYWADEQVDAPDVGGSLPPTYSNLDLTLQHQFRNGYGIRLTGYFKRGFNLPSLSILRSGPPDPATLAPSYTIYGAGSNGLEKTSGVDMYVATPDRANGFSGFLTATYTNAINNVPPGAVGEEGVDPLYNASAAALNAVYREGFISPFVARTGLTYKRSGFRVNTVITYDRGYPIGVGNLAPFGGNTPFAVGAAPSLNGTYLTVIDSNLGLAAPYAYGNTTGYKYTPNYVDPVNPGSYLRPNIAATRGTAEGSNTGSLLSHPRVGADLVLEYSKNRNTFGFLIQNLANNAYGLNGTTSGNEPTPNDRYQAVVNGVAGPQTGTVSGIFPISTSPSNVNQYNYGVRPYTADQGGRGAYIIPFNTNATPRSVRFYYQLAL